MKQKVIVICGAWLLFSFLNLLIPERAFSEVENRYLQQRPRASKDEILDGSYMEQFETWMTDQLVFRDDFVSLKASTDQLLGRGDSGGVYLGRDGYLLEMFTELPEEQLQKNLDEAASFLKRMEEQGRTVHFLMIPTGACVMEEKLPAFAPEINQTELFAKLEQKLPGFVHVEKELIQAQMQGPLEQQLYYRTDHHWTSLGAYYAYKAFCEARGKIAPDLSEYEIEVLSTEFYGTSYSKAGLYTVKPDTMTAMYQKDGASVQIDYGTGEVENSLYDESFLEKRDKYRVYLKGNYPLTKITTSVQNGKRLLLVKDSYANTFVQFLKEDYEEIFMVDLRYFRQSLDEYVEEQEITDVLFLYQIKNFSEDRNFSF